MDVLSGGKGKKQKEKEAQKNWFASKVCGGDIPGPVAVLIAFHRSIRWLEEVKPENSMRISWTKVLVNLFSGNSFQLTDHPAVDLFQQHILGQGDQVRTDGLSLSR